MKLKPGGVPWLLRHEVRMYFYGLAARKNKHGASSRSLSKLSMLTWLAFGVVLHGIAWVIVTKLPLPEGELPFRMLAMIGAIMAVGLTMMLSAGLRASVEALFERDDLDLLLSSPLSTRSIFTVRLGGVVIGVASIYLMVLAPLAHAGLASGNWRWLGVYPTIISLAMIFASLAMLGTLGLVRLLGVRRTRVVAQILGALSGAAVFIGSQLFSNSMGEGKPQAMARVFAALVEDGPLGPASIAWLPVRALLGAPWPMALLALSGIAAFAFTVRFTHAFFVRGLQQAEGMALVAAPAGAPRFTFGRGLARSILVKEWRLISRDPQLISQVLLQLLYLLPLCFIMFSRSGVSLPAMGAGLSLLCGSLASALGWIIISAEDAPDLLLAAPCSQATIRRAKIAAVAVPPLAVVALPALWTGLQQPLAAAAMLLMVGLSVLTSTLVVLRMGRPAQRSDFRHRAKGNVMQNILETFISIVWAGLTFFALWWLTGRA